MSSPSPPPPRGNDPSEFRRAVTERKSTRGVSSCAAEEKGRDSRCILTNVLDKFELQSGCVVQHNTASCRFGKQLAKGASLPQAPRVVPLDQSIRPSIRGKLRLPRPLAE